MESKFQQLMQRVRAVEQQLNIDLSVCIKNTEYSHLVDGYGENVDVYAESEWGDLLSSASYFGPRDILITYSEYIDGLCDYPDVTIENIKKAHNAAICLEKLVEDLRQDGFYNVDLMQPRARSLASDNYVFIIGLNLKEVSIPYMEKMFIDKVSEMYGFEDDVLQHIATVYASARSDEEFISGLDSGLEDMHDSLLMLRKHLLKSPDYLSRIIARPGQSQSQSQSQDPS